MDDVLSQFISAAGGGIISAGLMLFKMQVEIAVMNQKIDSLSNEVMILRKKV